MRRQELRLIITFQTTTEAMAAEKLCKSGDVPGRLIPLPREISAGCGLAWCTACNEHESMKAFLGGNGLKWQRFYDIYI